MRTGDHELLYIQVRIKLNSLTQAFNHRSDQQATSHSVHKLMLGVFALSNALDEGLPASQQKAALQASCADDGLISLAIDSLPKSTGNQVGLLPSRSYPFTALYVWAMSGW